ncbi:MAG: site-specific integrase [Phycisphaerales bacterium]|nr:site-specific integrase [Phycisphaerae bacterium]NNF45046.1 site-specific integrase [Phycisphaerales bacterium]NNM27475.1 site-specific integrase [Phycisphaerales bacterium]
MTLDAGGRIRGHLEKLGRAGSTQRKTLSSLRAMLNNAVAMEWIQRNPLAGEQLGPPPKKEKRIFTDAEVNAMLAAAPDRWWEALIQLAYTSGLRKSEMLHLRWDDIDTDAGFVQVQERRDARVKAGMSEVPVFAWKPKTKTSARSVPVPPETLSTLLRLNVWAGGSPYVFVPTSRLLHLDRLRREGKLHDHYRILTELNPKFRKIQLDAAAATGKKNWRIGTLHDLRKTFGSRAAAKGVPMTDLHKHMGHASIATTSENYVQPDEGAAERLRRVFA